MAKITLDFPNIPKGEELEIPGVGIFKNGATVELDKDQVASWERANSLEFPSGGLSLPLKTTAKTKTPQAPEPPEKPGVAPLQETNDKTGGGS